VPGEANERGHGGILPLPGFRLAGKGFQRSETARPVNRAA
jgi:hypothetical protein